MRVCILVDDLAAGGPAPAALAHAARLRAAYGMDVTVAALDAPPAAGVERFSAARDRGYDVALAASWRACARLFEVGAERHAYWVRGFDNRRFRPDQAGERLAASLTYDLPVAFVAGARWIAEVLEELRPDAPCFLVRPGRDGPPVGAEPPEPRLSGPLRVLVDGDPSWWLDDVEGAMGAVAQMREPVRTAWLRPGPDTPAPAVDEVIDGRDARAAEAAFERADVVLRLGRVDGALDAPLRAFAAGATVVMTPVFGHEELVRHRVNGLIADWDDVRGTARWLDLLARDRALLHSLRAHARDTARAWPSAEQSSTMLAAALYAIARRPRPGSTGGAGRLLADAMAEVTEIERQKQLLIAWQRSTQGELDRVRNTVSYRAGLAVKERLGEERVQRARGLLKRLYHRVRALLGR